MCVNEHPRGKRNDKVALFFGFFLVTLHHIGRVLGSCFPRAEGDKADGYGEDYGECGNIYPPRRSDAVGKRL